MSKCRDLEPLFAPYVDGDVPAGERASIDTHIDRCPPCRARVVRERTAHDVLHARRDVLRAAAPEALRARCAVQREGARITRLMARRPWLPLSLAATVLLAVAGVFVFGLNDSVEALAAQLTLDHVKCFRLAPTAAASTPDRAAELWAADQGWGIKVPASSERQQLEFVCVRRCVVTEGRVAHLMYRWRGQPLSLYVLPSQVGDAGGSEVVERFGHEAMVWTGGGRTYVLLARVRADEDFDGLVQYVKANAW